MTAEAPDPRSFKSADDAFQYPVPVVRKLEQQLRHNADDNREKLRSLVGASYRDLLGTAERIIEMDRQMQNVESTLGLIGQKCNSRRVDKISRNYSGLTEYTRKLDAERFSFAAQLAVLQTCPTVIRRALKKGSTLLAAKILVISRLLHKNLVQAPSPPPFVESLKNQLASLRRKLLHTIDKQFSRFSSETNDVLEITSSLTAVLDTWDSKSRDEVTSLWDPSTSSIDTSNGAPLFKRAIIERSHGLNESLSQLISTYDQWAQSLKDAYAVIKEMKDTKWDDDLNGDDEDEDFDLESKQALLSEDDPRSLEDSLKEALSTAFAELQKDVESLVSKTLATPEDATAPKAILIVRALREAMVSRGGDLWSPGAVGVLKKQISEESATVLSECISAIRGAADPSEKADSTSHGDENGDAANEDRENEGANPVGEKVAADGEESKKANKTASPPSADVQKDKLTHLLFDVCYLQRVFALKSTEESPLAAVEKQLQEASGVDKPALERLKKNAGDYWRKTYLLFALLL
ncbi:Vps51/Vps67 [Neofusicoccum parvum]|nr:Vps51/Vps67 [Neofusicoccum parvum]